MTKLWSVVAVMALALAACGGNGEDRPGQVSSEGGGSGTASASASGTHTGSASASGTQAGSGAEFSEDEADAVVPVTARDYAFDGIPQTIKGPKVYFEVTNEGAAVHELAIESADGEEVAEVEDIDPGKEKSLAVELEPGTYTVVCHVEEGAKTHEELGMKFTFTVE